MPLALLYLLKVSVSLTIVWSFYQLLLRRLTFYNLNRWYLLGYSCLCFFIPLIDIGSALEKRPAGGPLLIQYIPSLGDYPALSALPKSGQEEGGVWNVLFAGMLIGAVALFVRMALRWFSLRGIRRRSRLIEEGGVKIYRVDAPITPFSFGNAVYINPQLHSGKEWSEIILHEYVHIRQKHTFDILAAEFICIVNWYNPFAWLMRHSIRQNLEFIADQQMLENGIDKKGYQYHLLKVVGEARYRLVNNFNFSSLKKRIVMMNKIRSARLHLVKFFFVLPLIGVLLVAFRNRYDQAGQVNVKAGGYDVARQDAPVGKISSLRNASAEKISDRSETDTIPGLPRNFLYVVDGEIKPVDLAMKSLTPDMIASIEVLKNEQALRLFGEKGENGVVAIITKTFAEKHPEVVIKKPGDPAKAKADPGKPVMDPGNGMADPVKVAADRKKLDAEKQKLTVDWGSARSDQEKRMKVQEKMIKEREIRVTDQEKMIKDQQQLKIDKEKMMNAIEKMKAEEKMRNDEENMRNDEAKLRSEKEKCAIEEEK